MLESDWKATLPEFCRELIKLFPFYFIVFSVKSTIILSGLKMYYFAFNFWRITKCQGYVHVDSFNAPNFVWAKYYGENWDCGREKFFTQGYHTKVRRWGEKTKALLTKPNTAQCFTSWPHFFYTEIFYHITFFFLCWKFSVRGEIVNTAGLSYSILTSLCSHGNNSPSNTEH